MSHYMLSDANTINDYNPFVMGVFAPPGATSNPHDYSRTDKEVERASLFEMDGESPACDFGITMGDDTISVCRPSKPNCPMERNLLPDYNFDYDILPEKPKVRGMYKIAEQPTLIFLTLTVVVMLIALARR